MKAYLKMDIYQLKLLVKLTSDTVTNTNGIEIQRTGGAKIGIKTCCFKVSNEELQCSKHKFTREMETEFTYLHSKCELCN